MSLPVFSLTASPSFSLLCHISISLCFVLPSRSYSSMFRECRATKASLFSCNSSRCCISFACFANSFPRASSRKMEMSFCSLKPANTWSTLSPWIGFRMGTMRPRALLSLWSYKTWQKWSMIMILTNRWSSFGRSSWRDTSAPTVVISDLRISFEPPCKIRNQKYYYRLFLSSFHFDLFYKAMLSQWLDYSIC